MKLKDLLTAQEPLKHLGEKRFTGYKKLREITRLLKAVEQEVELYKKEETKAIKTYAELGEDGSPLFLSDGRLRLKNMEAKIAFEKEIDELRETDIDIGDTVSLSETDFRSADDLPTPDEMLALEAVIRFIE